MAGSAGQGMGGVRQRDTEFEECMCVSRVLRINVGMWTVCRE